MLDVLVEKREALEKNLAGESMACTATAEGLVIRISPSAILDLLLFLRDDRLFSCSQLMDIIGVDRLGLGGDRFQLTYSLLSLAHNERTFVEITFGESERVPSVAPAYRSAAWLEREVFEMYGILFSGNGDLRRLFTEASFGNGPLRKDYEQPSPAQGQALPRSSGQGGL